MNIPESSIRPFEPLGVPALRNYLSYEDLVRRITNMMLNVNGASTRSVANSMEVLASMHGVRHPECTYYPDGYIEPGECGEVRPLYILRFMVRGSYRTIRMSPPMRIRKGTL